MDSPQIGVLRPRLHTAYQLKLIFTPDLMEGTTVVGGFDEFSRLDRHANPGFFRRCLAQPSNGLDLKLMAFISRATMRNDVYHNHYHVDMGSAFTGIIVDRATTEECPAEKPRKYHAGVINRRAGLDRPGARR